MSRLNIKVVVGALLIVVTIAIVVVVVITATRQPQTSDFKRLDYQRQIVDNSMNAYGPLFNEFTTEYANKHLEERTGDEKSTFKSESTEVFEQEERINSDRLKQMGSSVALREPAVKEAFDSFSNRYGSVVNYYAQHVKNMTNITESVGGPCSQLMKLNIAKADYATSYTKTADTCLSALDSAKETSDPATDELLGDVEKLIKTRRDKWQDTIGKDGFEKNIANIYALLSFLDINAEVSDIQTRYESKVKSDYSNLVEEANKSNANFEKTLKKHTTAAIEQGGDV